MIDSAGRSRRTDIITQNGGYKGGYVYLASAEGRAGILPNLNGTLLDPVNTFADAFAIMGLSKIRNLYVLPQSSATNIVLPSSFAGFNVNGRDFTVNINGKHVEHTHFLAGHISGAFTGIPHFEHCEATDLTGGGCYMFDVAIDGVFTNNANNAIWLLNGAYTKTPGEEAVTFDFGVGKTGIALMLRHHSGGMHLHNMKDEDVMTAEGDGQIIIDANCTGGSISRRGHWQVTDYSGGAVKIINDDTTQASLDGAPLVGAFNTVVQLYETGGTTPIADADVSVWNSDLSLLLGLKKTDANGQLSIGRDAGTYKLVPQKGGWTFSPPLTLTVVANATHPYYGDTVLIPQPGAAEECVLYVDIIDIENEYSEGVVFTVTLKTAPKAVGGKLIDPTSREYKTDTNGHKEITLVKGCKYTVDSKALPQGIDIDTTDQTSINMALQI